VETYKLATGGWKLSRESVDKLIPDLKELLSSLPSKTLIIFFCSDNSSFLAANEASVCRKMTATTCQAPWWSVLWNRNRNRNQNFSKVGTGTAKTSYGSTTLLVVAPERAMKHEITGGELRRAIAECGDFPVLVVTPWTRYASKPCCTDAGHVMNFQDPDFLADLL
jgi:hypothetical protein